MLKIGWSLVLLMLCMSASSLHAQTDGSAEEDNQAYRKKLQKFADSYTVYATPDQDRAVKRLEKPIFRWGNPIRQANGGACFLWTHQGRPHATLGIWNLTNESDQIGYEVQSLAPEPFVATSTRVGTWAPQSSGADYVQIDKVDSPAQSKTRRLLQMRQIAKRNFSATLAQQGKPKETLRLLPQPIYRYDRTPKDVIDGAMFSFAWGTDPEVFLILEAREVDGETNWYFAMAPSTSANVEGLFRGKVVMDNQTGPAGQPRIGTFLFRQGASLE